MLRRKGMMSSMMTVVMRMRKGLQKFFQRVDTTLTISMELQ
jgi:hypothetical protein